MTQRFRTALFLAAITAGFGCLGACMRAVGGASGDAKPRTAVMQHHSSSISSSSEPAGSLLTVNGETVSAADLWKGLHDELHEQARTGAPEVLRQYVERRAAQLITDRISELALYQHARSALSADSDDKITAYIDAEIRRVVTLEFGGAQRSYEAHLESKGQTLADAREALRRELIIRSFIEQEIKPKLTEPTRSELHAEYERRSAAYRKPPRRRMSLIDVRVAAFLPEGETSPTPQQVSAARAEARSQAQAALNELRGGAAFAAVARRYSHGLHAAEGGEWGWIAPGSVRERFEPALAALYQLAEATVSDIVEAEDGFFVVRCDEIDPGSEPDFQSLQPELTAAFFREAFNRRIADLVDDLRAKASIQPADLRTYHDAAVRAALDILAEAPPS